MRIMYSREVKKVGREDTVLVCATGDRKRKKYIHESYNYTRVNVILGPPQMQVHLPTD